MAKQVDPGKRTDFHKTMAKMIYKELFAIIAEIEEYGFSIDLDINRREERARPGRVRV